MRKVTMYSGDPCPYCNAAKALLKSKNVEIEEFDIWKDSTKAKEMLQRTNGARTIPIDACIVSIPGGPLISVIIPIHNTPKAWLADTINTVRGQT